MKEIGNSFSLRPNSSLFKPLDDEAKAALDSGRKYEIRKAIGALTVAWYSDENMQALPLIETSEWEYVYIGNYYLGARRAA